MLSKLVGTVQSWLGEREAFDERRRVVRLTRKLPVDCFRSGPFNAAVIDLGVGGMLIETGERLKVGQEIQVRSTQHPTSEFVKCRVQWVRLTRGDRQVAGLKFIDAGEKLRSSWVKEVLTQTGLTPENFRQRRHVFRVPAHLLAQVREPEGDFSMKAMVRDMSLGGATFLAFTRLPAGKLLLLCIGSVPGVPPLTLKCHVLTTRFDPVREQTRYNVCFMDVDDRQVREIRKVLRFLMKRAVEAPPEEED